MAALAARIPVLYRHAFPGTAICDWLPQLRTQLANEHPKTVVLAFAGNNLTPCMRPGGRMLSGAELAGKYHRDAAQALGYAQTYGAQLVLVRTPVGDPRWQQADITGDAGVIRSWTLLPGAWLLDGGKYLNPNGIYRNVIDGQQTHRADGLHLTPYGAQRYAQAIIDGLTRIGLAS